MKVLLVIPAYNEQNRIRDTVNFYVDVFRKAHILLKLIVVSESTDNTNKIIKGLKKENISLISSKSRLGKGGAIVQGFKSAVSLSVEGDIIGFVDADNAVYASEVIRMLNYMKSHPRFSGAIASRYLKGSALFGNVPLSRKLASRAYNILVRILFGLSYKDTQCGAKIFKRDAIVKILPTLSIVDMSFDINLLYSARLMGFRVKEFPISYRQNNEGTKLVMRRQIPQMLVATVGFRISRSRLGKYIPSKAKGFVYDKVKRW